MVELSRPLLGLGAHAELALNLGEVLWTTVVLGFEHFAAARAHESLEDGALLDEELLRAVEGGVGCGGAALFEWHGSVILLGLGCPGYGGNALPFRILRSLSAFL